MFRKLLPDEIEIRVQSITEKGAVLLLYKDARVDQVILDETVGPMNWQRMHLRDNQNCVVSIWCDKKQIWVSKEDTGTESNTEKEKGLASDSFKRACFNWGIGRELYTSPFVFVNANQLNMTQKNGKPATYDKFEVKEIYYTDNHISGIVIRNQKGVEVFRWGSFPNASKDTTPPKKPVTKQSDKPVQSHKITPEQASLFVEACAIHNKDVAAIVKYFKHDKLEDMTQSELKAILTKWEGEQ